MLVGGGEARDNSPGPVEILALALNAPIGRRTVKEGAQIGNLVSNFQGLRANRLVRRGLYLERFASLFGQRLVICYFHDERCDVLIERLTDFLPGNSGIFHNVMEKACHDEVYV